jgi:hypothetical protein
MTSLRARISRLEQTTRPEHDPPPPWLQHTTNEELAELWAIYDASDGRDLTKQEAHRTHEIRTSALKRIGAGEQPNPPPDSPTLDEDAQIKRQDRER